MAFRIRMGVPEMEAFWNDVSARKLQGKRSKEEEKFFKKLVKALAFLGQNPRHPGLASHEIDDLTRKHGMKIFQSYLENQTPAAGRLFWAYGPDQGDLTVVAIETITLTHENQAGPQANHRQVGVLNPDRGLQLPAPKRRHRTGPVDRRSRR